MSREMIRSGVVLQAWSRLLRGYTPLLSIEITRECPLRCPGCYAYTPNHLGNGVALRQLHDLRDEALVEEVMRLVRKHRPLQLSIVGGEPLLRRRELDRILPRLSAEGVFTLVVTSAVAPFPKAWNALPKIRVAVSIDGLQPDHDQRRKPATYDRIIENIAGRQVDISWVITRPMLDRATYLDEYLAFWTSRPEVDRVWPSVYTPQVGEKSPEMLTPVDRRQLIERLPDLKARFPALILPDGAIEALAAPPSNPESCMFSQLSVNYSADLRTRVEPCFFGGAPDCTQCGCAVSTGLHWLQQRHLALGVRVGHLLKWSQAIAGTGRRIPSQG